MHISYRVRNYHTSVFIATKLSYFYKIPFIIDLFSVFMSIKQSVWNTPKMFINKWIHNLDNMQYAYYKVK